MSIVSPPVSPSMGFAPIGKSAADVAGANLRDIEAERAAFTWEGARGLLAGLPGGGLNMAHEAVDRHVAAGFGEARALRFVAVDGTRRDVAYAELARETSRFANVLRGLGVAPGERVFTLLGRTPSLYVAALGTLKAGCVLSPLFAAFGPEPVQARMTIGAASVLVTSERHYRRKVAPWRDALPGLRHVLLVDGEGEPPPGTASLPELMARAGSDFETVRTRPDDMALLHFTSGTTGRPKGAIHVHEAILAHRVTGRFALDLHADEIYWCTADPGWVTGTSYGILAPLANRARLVVDEAEFDAERWYGIIEAERVAVWYTAPTAIRMLMKAGAEAARAHDLSSLRFLASVGEPLNPEAVVWSAQAYGRPFHDNWWQTETGGIMIANTAAMEIRPGSMGKPLPGIEAAILARDDAGLSVIAEPLRAGELALKVGWPSMMRGYLDEEERTRKAFADGYYLTGDLAMRDADGYFWFVGRADDMIKSAGHLIGPFEVESALLEHETVAEAGVVGLPDPVAGEIVVAYVALKAGFAGDEALERALVAHARKRLGPAVAPRRIVFRQNLPKTRSGKIMRRLLKARALGLPEGDLSTLESEER